MAGELLPELLRRHNALAIRSEGRLREFLESEGMPKGESLVKAWGRNGIAQRGLTTAGDRYAFHGVGCVISLRGEQAVDIDWNSEGRILVDVWHIRRWIERVGNGEISGESITAAMEELVRAGEATAVGFGKYRLPEHR